MKPHDARCLTIYLSIATITIILFTVAYYEHTR
jgi:hypothetical protein